MRGASVLRRARRLRRLRPAVPGSVRVLVGAGAAAGLVWAATVSPLPLDLARAAGATQGAAADISLATSVATMCPGNELSGLPGVPDAEVGGTAVVAGGPQDLLPVPADGEGGATLSAGSSPVAELSRTRPSAARAAVPPSGPLLLEGEGSLAPAVVGAQEWLVAVQDLRGLSTTPCRAATSDLWLLAGGAGPGRQERLVLTNPGGNPVTAEVTVHGATGPVGTPRSEAVAPGGRVTLLLDAIAPDEATPAVHVVAGGGGLHAALSDTWVQGSTPLGAETVVASAAPGTVQVVPATPLGGRSVLRVAAPGADEAVTSITVLGRDGEVNTLDDTVLSVPGGGVGELALPAVEPGTYSVVVRSDVPVVAAVRTELGGGGTVGEIGWAASAPVVPAVGAVALPATADVARTLRLVSTGGGSTAQVSLVVDGAVRNRAVDLLSERSVEIDLAGAEAVWVRRTSGSGALRGGVVATRGEGPTQFLSVVPLDPVAVTSPVSRAFPLP